MALYERRNGAHASDRERAADGSDRQKELQALVDDGVDNWVCVEEPKKRRAKKDDPAGSQGGGDGDNPPLSEMPAKNASQEAWAAYAIAQGADGEEAKAASRDDLVKAYGG